MRPTRLRGAKTHNLRGLDLDLAPGTLVAIAGPSGAGKSSLAFGTLYAEGQRRYVESFSAYARQFLERLARPPVDELDPVPAGIAVDRQAPVKTSRSTVATMTEIADYAKGLWARIAQLGCPGCGRPVGRDHPAGAAEEILAAAPGARVTVTYPVSVADAEQFLGVRDALLADGYRRLRVGGDTRDLDAVRPSDILGKKRKKSDPPAQLEVVADRTVAREDDRARLVEALEAAMRRGAGRADVHLETRGEGAGTFKFSRGLHCAHCDRSFRDANPGLFSFNNPIGACDTCRGFGRVIGIDWQRVIPDGRRTLAAGAIKAWTGQSSAWERKELLKHAKRAGVPTDVPWDRLEDAQRRWVIDGEGKKSWREGWWGLRRWFEWVEGKSYKMHVRVFLARYRSYDTCTSCHGSRLKAEAMSWRVGGQTIADLYAMTVDRALDFLSAEEQKHAADPATSLLLRECTSRLRMLADVGLGYLTLDRQSRTLSGGEAQRVALTSALGASLTGAMFVLDEPTVGLHPRDVDRLFGVVRRLASGDNLALIVEHDPHILRGADRIVELGPGAGEHGGAIVFDGTPEGLAGADTPTGRVLRAATPPPREPRQPRGWLRLRGARGNNLRGVDADVPLGALTVVTGPSGSGKSSLVLETLCPAAKWALGERGIQVLPHDGLEGTEHLHDVTQVDQAPLGRTSRGNPATYLKAWDVVRRRFSQQRLAKDRGYGPGTFSFNVPGGRCEACKGEGSETVEMQFLADVTFSCPECQGRRFVGAVLDVTYRDKSVADVLEMTATEALALFAGDKDLEAKLRPLADVGLGYLRLGQPLSTLSGGEAQRLKLAEALSRVYGSSPKAHGQGTLLILDEPTAGLHAEDVEPLLRVLDTLVDRGDTVVVVEHDMRVAAHADWVIDLGPGAGADGGEVVAVGTPREVAANHASVTSSFLAEALGMTAQKRPSVVARATGIAHALTAIEREPITVVGAREHNLRDVSVEIPREKMVVVTGPSGSGKSTLAFDVVYAEGQRRYLETLSPYARQYLPQLPRPAVDRVAGVPPTVSLEQRTTRGGANSTVATITEVAHYLRLLWARAGLLHCPDCRIPIAARSAAQIAQDLRARAGAHPSRTEVTVLAPVVRSRKGHHGEVFTKARKDGYTEARVDGKLTPIAPAMRVARFKEHDIDLVVGRFAAAAAELEPALRRALALGDGTARALVAGQDLLLSAKRTCPSCGQGYPELDPRFFSFNTKQGQCAVCEGRGYVEKERRGWIEQHDCTACGTTRLSPLARAVTVDGRPITEVLGRSVSGAREEVARIRLVGRDAEVGEACIGELERRLAFLEQVGLGYLGLDRAADTLSGGEMQRVRLAAQLGSGLTGVLYVLDEPTIGLHPRDTGKLLSALRSLVDKGCSVLVVEHDTESIRAADHVIDVGPGGGRNGGRIVAEGAPSVVAKNPRSITGPALARPLTLRPSPRPVTRSTPFLEVLGASEHNLKDVHLRVPAGRFVAVTGVSGSGKSTLVRDVLLRAARQALGLETEPPGAHRAVRGMDAVQRAVEVDQSPIGRTPRSVPATYVGVWDEIRKLLATIPDARARGYEPSRFSFNVKGGRCDACEGQGALAVEMSFLPEVLVPCEACGGKRFGRETLDVQLHGLDVGQILELDVDDALATFAAVPKVVRPLRIMSELGLGYLKLGQPSNTLSGGEAQRLKLVAELGTGASGATLYVLDEPTTGLHRDDVGRLLGVFDKLVDRGDTIVVVEHHLDVVAAADWVIDLGPEGGEAGGEIVFAGAPADLVRHRASHTAAALRHELALPGTGTKRRASAVVGDVCDSAP